MNVAESTTVSHNKTRSPCWEN